MGILNTSGTTIIPIKFNDIIIEEGIFYLRIGKNMYVWDKVEKFIVPAIYDYISTDEGIIYTRKGRNKYKIENGEEFINKIGYDQSCGYINNPSIFAYDKSLNDLLAAPTE